MPVISGTLRDFGLAAFPGQQPEIVFRANQPAVTSGGAILATKEIKVTPNSAGDWSVTLSATDTLATGGIWYTIEITWQDPANNYTQVDFPDWRLFVPGKGGDLADLLEKPANPSLVWVSLTAPSPTPGMKWLEASPDGAAGTGNLYEWSN
ncbi:hypothetical protein [Arthrobacter sp. UYCu723]